MSTNRDEALEYHRADRPGKIEVVATKPVSTQRDLSLAYSPGVAEPCREIEGDPLAAFEYTARGNLVAVVSNGTAVLGLGDIGPLAAKPVMEGKGVLFKRFAGIDVFDIEIDAPTAAEVIRFCEMLEPTVGGINLEDIAAPDCFVVEKALKERLDIPVFHDDQHGTAIIGAAALLNALELVGKEVEAVRVVFSGAGASALATAEHLARLGVPGEQMTMCDSTGVIYEGRPEGMNEYKERWAVPDTGARSLADAVEGADVFIGLSVAGILTQEMVASMAPDPVIFALANPDPEILPEEAHAVRDDVVIATGRSDYPNQVNNVLGFPFIFRGALDVRATGVNAEMMLAATRALAELARTEVPEAVQSAYDDQALAFGRDYLIPKPVDDRVLYHVAPAVARAAMGTGAARVEIDLDEYRERLRASLGPSRAVMRWMSVRARSRPTRVVLPEGDNDTVIRAAVQMVEEGVCRPVLLGRRAAIEARARALGEVDLGGVDVVDVTAADEMRGGFARTLFRRRARKGLTLTEAEWKMSKPIYLACGMLAAGEAGAVVAGIEANYPEVIRPALEVVGADPAMGRVAGLHMVAFPNRDLLFFADTTVTIDPDARALSEIALLSAGFVEELGITPRIALISFSNFGSARHPESDKVARAVELVRRARPELEVDGELQADTALDARRLTHTYPFSHLTHSANVLVFGNLTAANAAFKLLGSLSDAELIGPVLLGMARPVHVLHRGCAQQDVLNLATVASVDAQARS
jgi:malate dehydrogenase (oxaloacetate-decarboxylating)(NADP+)